MRRSFWQSKDFQRYFLTYILLFTGMLMAGVILVAHISQKERNSAAEQQRRAQTEKITEVLDSTWESAASIGDILNNAVWVEKYKSDTSVFDAEFDVLQKREISQFLGEVCTFNTTIRDIAVLYNRKDVAVTPKGWFSLSDYQAYAAQRLQVADGFIQNNVLDLQGGFGQQRPGGFAGVNEGHLVYVCQLDIMDPPRVAAVMYLDKSSLAKKVGQVCSEQVAGVRVLDENGNECWTGQFAEPGTEAVRQTAPSQNMLLTYEITFQNQPLPFMQGAGGYLLLLLLAMLGAFLAYILAIVQYSPVNQLLCKVKERTNGENVKQDMDAIATCIDELFNDKERLEQTVSSYRYTLREQRNVQLLKGFFGDDVSDLLDVQEIPFVCDYAYAVLVLHRRHDGMESVTEETQANLRFVLIVEQIIENLHLGQSHCELVENVEGNTAVIAEFPTLPDKDAVMDLAGTMYDALAEQDIECCIYVGRPCKGLAGISTSYQAAMETIRREEHVRGVVYAHPQMEYYYPLDWEGQLARAVREGNVTQAKVILHQLYEENKRLDLGRDLVKRVATLLYETMRRIVIEAKLPDRMFQELTEPQYAVSLEQLFRSAESLVKKLCEEMIRKKEEAATNVNRSLVGYVNENVFDPNLSLNQLSDLFGVSNASVSRIFKKTAGSNFYRYITEKRIERAKELLRLRGYCPAEIAAEVGYDSEYSFKRAFQRTFGMNPREYVEQQNGAKSFENSQESGLPQDS